ncbi:MAG: TetR/AcrR family transcriptional regulator [Solirubrobacterales bacterium]|nr:TetR/AcrR family transcriptional regulator [Solirubrobacterales bacterium]
MGLAQEQAEIDPGRLPSGRHGLPREAVARSQRDRLVESMIAVVAEKGYTEATVADVIQSAGVSRATFYEQFADKEDCFVAAYTAVMDRMLEHVAEGVEAAGSDAWVDRVRGGLARLLQYLADNPVSVRTGIVEAFGAGARARDRYQQAVGSFFPFLEAGRGLADRPDQIPAEVPRLIVGGVSALMFAEASEGRAAGLPDLLPEVMYLVIAPYLGREAALKVMEETREAGE